MHHIFAIIIFFVFVVIVYWRPISAMFKVKALERKYQEERNQLKPLYGVWMICYDGPMGVGSYENAGPQFAEAMKHLSFAANTAVAVLDSMEAQCGKKSA